MFGENLLIKKQPYLSKSNCLIEYFCVIGYNETFIPELLNQYKDSKEIFQNDCYKIDTSNNIFRPTILNYINNKRTKMTLESDLILYGTYPDNPHIEILKNNKNNKISEKKINDIFNQESNIIFSNNISSEDGEDKIFINYYSLRFYEMYQVDLKNVKNMFKRGGYSGKKDNNNKGKDNKDNNENTIYCFIPKAICIISEYPYFSSFRQICRFLREYISKEENKDIPIELLIYNIVNFIPSPINFSVKVNIFNNNEKRNANMTSINNRSNSTYRQYNSYNTQIRRSTVTLKPEYKIDHMPSSLSFKQLSGYPYFDFDLYEIFNIIPLNIFLEVFIYTVLQIDVIVFCSDLEVLNLILYTYSYLNYPCNDSSYFWNLYSASSQRFREGQYQESDIPKTVFALFSGILNKIIGVNCQFEENMNTYSLGKNHFILDVDGKNVIFREQEDDEKLRKFHKILNEILKQKENSKKKTVFLKNLILQLYSKLTVIIEGIKTSRARNPLYNNISNCLYKCDSKIFEDNVKIQEAFYDFYLNFLLFFYGRNSLASSFDRIEKDDFDSYALGPIEDNVPLFLRFDQSEKDLSHLSEEEIYFTKSFKDCYGYLAFDNFVSEFTTPEVYKVSMMFLEEFINLRKGKEGKNLANLRYFKIIDNFYFNENENKKFVVIDLDSFIEEYYLSMKPYFQFFYDIKTGLINGSNYFDINKKIINIYIFVLSNLYTEKPNENNSITNFFPYIQYIRSEVFKKIKRSLILSYSLSELIHSDLVLDLRNFLYYCLSIAVCLLSYLLPNQRRRGVLSSLRDILPTDGLLTRESIYSVLKTYYRLFEVGEEWNKDKEKDDLNKEKNNEEKDNKENNCMKDEEFDIIENNSENIVNGNDIENDNYKENKINNKTDKIYVPKIGKEEIKIVYFIMVNMLRNNRIIPNEEIMSLLLSDLYRSFVKKKEDAINIIKVKNEDDNEEDVISLTEVKKNINNDNGENNINNSTDNISFIRSETNNNNDNTAKNNHNTNNSFNDCIVITKESKTTVNKRSKKITRKISDSIQMLIYLRKGYTKDGIINNNKLVEELLKGGNKSNNYLKNNNGVVCITEFEDKNINKLRKLEIILLLHGKRYVSKLIHPKNLFLFCRKAFEDFINEPNLDITKITEEKQIISTLVNLIFYSEFSSNDNSNSENKGEKIKDILIKLLLQYDRKIKNTEKVDIKNKINIVNHNNIDINNSKNEDSDDNVSTIIIKNSSIIESNDNNINNNPSSISDIDNNDMIEG